MPPAAALAGSAVGGIASGIMGSNAANSAAEGQAAAAAQANGIQKGVYDDQKTAWNPYQQAGSAALGQLQDPSLLKSFGASDFQQDPGYQFRLQQGQQALDRSAASHGGLFSGAQMKASQGFGQDMASQEYQNAYNRFNNDQSNRFNRLSSLTGYGTMANNALGQAGQNYADQTSQNLMGAANARGAAGMQSANMWGNTLSGIGKMGMDYASSNASGLFNPMQSTNYYPQGGGAYGSGNQGAPGQYSLGMNYKF